MHESLMGDVKCLSGWIKHQCSILLYYEQKWYKYALHMNVYVVVNVSVYTAFRAVHCSVNKNCHIYQSGAIHV